MATPGGFNSGSAGGAGSDCEEDEQEEPSSPLTEDLNDGLNNLTLTENEKKPENADELQAFRQQWQRELESSPSSAPSQREPRPTTEPQTESAAKEDELSAFRSQWQRELGGTPSPQRTVPKPEPEEPLSDEDRAKQLFLKAVDFERCGKLYEAIQHYKRAMQIMPDVETRLYESSDYRADTPVEESETEEETREEPHPSDDEDAVDGEDLLTRLQRIVARRGRLCEPEVPIKGMHISLLPYEVILLIVRWVISCDLDAGSLERLGEASRGLYVTARQPDLWRALCVKTWGIDCATPRAFGFDSWRQMYIERPRLNLNGCYISKTTYLRHGENSFQDQSYRPWYLINYYRYLRFFPDGCVLMWTTAEEPAACVGQLRARTPRPALGIMAGHYRLIQDKVVIIIKKAGEKKPAQTSNTRFRSRRKEVHETYEQTFHMELEVRTVRGRRNWQLWWRRYAVCNRRDNWTTFEVTPAKFPPFAFSRVRAYTNEARAPLC